jgi:uncharacterized protein DUF6624
MRNYSLSILMCIGIASCINGQNPDGSATTNYDSLRLVLENMYDEDQEIRRILIDSVGFNSPNAGPFLQKMANIDMKNQETLKKVLAKYGWIEQSKIGPKAAGAFFYVIQHSNIELIDKWFPEFRRLADSGEADRSQCAMMEDRMLMWKGQRQTYGTQASEFRADKKMAIWPIQDPKNVNKRRLEVGFKTTIEEYAKKMNVIFDVNEKLPNEK